MKNCDESVMDKQMIFPVQSNRQVVTQFFALRNVWYGKLTSVSKTFFKYVSTQNYICAS